MAEWGNTFNLGDVYQTSMLYRALQNREQENEFERQQKLEKQRIEAEDRQREAATRRVAVQKMMANDMYKRAMSEGLTGDALKSRVMELFPAYQQVYKTIGGDWQDATPDAILSLATPDDSVLDARKQALIEQAKYGVRSAYGDTPLDQEAIRMREEQRNPRETPEEKLKRELTLKASPTYSDLHQPIAKQQLSPDKLYEKKSQFMEQIGAVDTALQDIQDAYKLQLKTNRTGPIIGSPLLAPLNKAIGQGGEDLQRLEKAYNRQAASALSAFKALGMAGALSEKEGEWVRSTESQLTNNQDVNLETMKRGWQLLYNRRKGIRKLASEYGLDSDYQGDEGRFKEPGKLDTLPPGWREGPDGRIYDPTGKPYIRGGF